MFEILAVIFGILQGISVALNKKSNWAFYIIQMIFMCIFSYQNHLYGDTLNNFIYIFFGIYGWISWSRPQSAITYLNTAQRILICIILLVGYILLRWRLTGTDDPLPAIDSFTTVSSVVATVLMMKRKVETWILWFINDVVYVVEYFLLPNQAIYLMFLNIVWTGLAVYSFINWKKIVDTYEKDLYCKTV